MESTVATSEGTLSKVKSGQILWSNLTSFGDNLCFFSSGNSTHRKGNKRNAELLDYVHDHLSLTQQTSPVTSTAMDVVRDHFNQAIHLNQLKLSNGGGSKVSSNEEDEEVLQQPLVRKSNYC